MVDSPFLLDFQMYFLKSRGRFLNGGHTNREIGRTQNFSTFFGDVVQLCSNPISGEVDILQKIRTIQRLVESKVDLTIPIWQMHINWCCKGIWHLTDGTLCLCRYQTQPAKPLPSHDGRQLRAAKPSITTFFLAARAQEAKFENVVNWTSQEKCVCIYIYVCVHVM